MSCAYNSSTTSTITDEHSCQCKHRKETVHLRFHQQENSVCAAHKRKPTFKVELSNFESIPVYLQNNPFIRTGYRVLYTTKECIRSIFSWSNETINIWTHLLGLFLFLSLLVYDVAVTIPTFQPTLGEKIVMVSLLSCYMATMGFSVAFHVFSARNEKVYFDCLRWDIAGIILSFTAIFISGIHYAFACFTIWRNIYEVLIGLLAVFVLTSHLKSEDRSFRTDRRRIVLFSLWAAFGIVPTGHWTFLEGGLQNPVIQTLLPRVIAMYLIVGVAFFFYLTRYPERCCPGRVDYLGSSHQLWHIFVVCALYWWHETGICYAQYRQSNTCQQEILQLTKLGS